MATLKPPLGKSLLPSRLPAINKRPASNVSENDVSDIYYNSICDE